MDFVSVQPFDYDVISMLTVTGFHTRSILKTAFYREKANLPLSSPHSHLTVAPFLQPCDKGEDEGNFPSFTFYWQSDIGCKNRKL